MSSRLYQQAVMHEPAVGVEQFNADELQDMVDWIETEAVSTEPPPAPPVEPLLAQRKPQYTLALSSMAMRVAQVPASPSELLAIDDAATPDGQRDIYNALVDLYLQPDASSVDFPDALGHQRPGVVENVFYNSDMLGSDAFRFTRVNFSYNARGDYHLYPSALARLARQWLGFGGIRSSNDNPTTLNEDNIAGIDAMMTTILEDRPIKEAFMTEHANGQTRACVHIPFSGYQIPQMTREVCRKNSPVNQPAGGGQLVPGGILGSRAFQRTQYGHFKFHTLRAMFQKFHCRDFPIFNNSLVNGADDSESRATVVPPWSEEGTRPYCASCHANSNMNKMALALWRFDDGTGVLRDEYRAVRPTGQRVAGPEDLVTSRVDPSKYYYKDQVLDSLEEWFDAFVADPDFVRCSAAQIYNFAMGRGSAATPEHPVPSTKIDALLSAYEAEFGDAENMTALRMLRVAFKDQDFTHR